MRPLKHYHLRDSLVDSAFGTPPIPHPSTLAQVNLGVLYLSGRVPGREASEALGCFKMAADQGDLSGGSRVCLL